jgi:hypothetical protein
MAFPFVFTGATDATGADLDGNFNAAGLLGTIPCQVSGTNALTLTPYTTPTIGTPPISLQAQLRFSGIAAVTNSGATTANCGSIGALGVYKDTSSGPAALSGGEIAVGNYFVLAYDAALNSGAGGYHLQTSASNAAGTVTGVVAGAGLAGGTISTLGTISIASISNNNILANISGGSAGPAAYTLSAILDAIMSSTQGAILARGASLWAGNTEQTYVPSLTLGGGSVSMTYGTQAGFYLAIGNLVIAAYNITLTAKGSSSGAAAISLPVAAGGGSRVGAGFVSNFSNLTSITTTPWAYIAPSASTAALYVAGSGTVTAVADTNIANNSTLAGMLAYFTG